MKYVIIHEELFSSKIARLLTDEIKRFDIRNEIQSFGCKEKNVKTILLNFKPDLVLVVGSNRCKWLVSLAKKLNIKSCFFYQSLLDTKQLHSTLSKADRLYLDLPSKDEPFSYTFNGSLLYEYVRKQKSHESVDQEDQLILILATRSNYSKRIKKFFEKRTDKFPEFNLQYISVEEDMEGVIDKLKGANMAIATDRLTSMLAIFTNCPMINTYKKSLFGNQLNRNSIINELLRKEMVKSIAIDELEELQREVGKILNDHQYCATILESYQEVKSIIGTSNVSRVIANDLVEWLDE